MRKFSRVATVGMALIGLSSAAVAGDFNLGGHLEAGYIGKMWPGTGNDDYFGFHAREALVSLGGKVGETEGYAEMAYTAGSQGMFYGYAIPQTAPGALFTHALAVNQVNITFHPGFMGGDSSWVWGLYRSPFGYEGSIATNNVFLIRSFAMGGGGTFGVTGGGIYPTYVMGTGVTKGFGMFSVNLHIVNSLNTFGGSFEGDDTPIPGGIIGATIGSMDNFYLKFNFGMSHEENTATFGNVMLIDTVIGANAIQNLKANLEFVWAKHGDISTKAKGWDINAMLDYMFHDDMGAALRFDYMKSDDVSWAPLGYAVANGSTKHLGFGLDFHYAIHKNIMAKLEYDLLKPSGGTGTDTKMRHIVAWTTVLHF
jgi:hypothetical protein